MTQKLSRIVASAALTVAVLTGSAITATPAKAAPGEYFALYCYESLGKNNPSRIMYIGLKFYQWDHVYKFSGRALLQFWYPGKPGSYDGGNEIARFPTSININDNRDNACYQMGVDIGHREYRWGAWAS